MSKSFNPDDERRFRRMPIIRPSDGSGIPITVTRKDDPAYALLQDDVTSTPVVHRQGCYICEDPEFAQMGLPLCRRCQSCGGHVAADSTVCDECGHDHAPPELTND